MYITDVICGFDLIQFCWRRNNPTYNARNKHYIIT